MKFQLNDRVVAYFFGEKNCPKKEKGTIVGFSDRDNYRVEDECIVLLDNPSSNGEKAMLFTEEQLKSEKEAAEDESVEIQQGVLTRLHMCLDSKSLVKDFIKKAEHYYHVFNWGPVENAERTAIQLIELLVAEVNEISDVEFPREGMLSQETGHILATVSWGDNVDLGVEISLYLVPVTSTYDQ